MRRSDQWHWDGLAAFRDDGATAIFGVDAGTTDLDDTASQVLQPRNVEFRLGVVAADFPRGRRREDAIGADNAPERFVANHEMVAEGVVVVAVDTRDAAGEACAHFVVKNPVTQFLCFEYFAFAIGKRDVETARLAQKLAGFGMQHVGCPVPCVAGHSLEHALQSHEAAVTRR